MRRLFTPRWIAIHLGVILLVVTMLNLGLWQLRRLDEKRTFNALVTTRTEQPIRDLIDVWPVDSVDSPSVIEWLPLRVRGTYVADKAVTVINRSQDGTAGYDSVVPLQLEDGRIVLVNRGFVPLATTAPTPPSGQREITGYMRESQRRTGLGPIDSTDITTTEFQRFDVPLISKRLSGTVLPFFVQLTSETPPKTGQWPSPVLLPELSEGPHLSYAFQWFFFCLVAVTAWGIVIRRRLSEPAAPADTSA